MIFTFYSYKGGVGRTMALANIAEYWYGRGANILMIDWDLESPGLETYFPHISQQAKETPGLIDMLLSYKERISFPPSTQDENQGLPFGNLSDYLIDVYKPSDGSGGALRLLSAGKRDGGHFVEYADRVKKFDWVDFYQNWLGEEYIEWLRREIENYAPITLIDSRNGVTEMSGVCTYQLADVVVAFVSSNLQSIEGTIKVVERLKSERLESLRPERSKLNIVVVPARIESNELERRNKFMQKFQNTFDDFVPTGWQYAGKSFWDLRIPYMPLYAFEELVAAREEREQGECIAPELFKAYLELWNAMVDSASPPGREPWRWRRQTEKILIVEGVASWQRLLETVITNKTGQLCDIAITREQALKKLEEKDYPFIVLNLNLSPQGQLDYGGVDVLKFLKSTGRQIPTLVLVDGPGIRTGNILLSYQPFVVEVLSRGAEAKDWVDTLVSIINEKTPSG
ncbi:MAG TPA: hypothetical protein PKZ84_15020 [Anaerolineae bacterium]|nr:hypothetical protein [Anaerolineae bacterium]HQI85776.1 hypothetical protein [Anaerolineae bacterium]